MECADVGEFWVTVPLLFFANGWCHHSARRRYRAGSKRRRIRVVTQRGLRQRKLPAHSSRWLPSSDRPRVRGTLRAIEHMLLVDDEFIPRHDTDDPSDGLSPGEGAFLACSVWLVSNYLLQQRYAQARKLFERLLRPRKVMTWLWAKYEEQIPGVDGGNGRHVPSLSVRSPVDTVKACFARQAATH
jgi:hypothetical protein